MVPWTKAEPVIPRYRSRIMPVLQEFEANLSASGGPFFGAATPGIGDLCLFAYMDLIVTLMPDMPDAVGPCMRTWFDACAKLPRVAEYLAERPQLGSKVLGSPGTAMHDGLPRGASTELGSSGCAS